jgi:hypothetical protein
LDTLPAPSANGASKVYQQLKDILRIAMGRGLRLNPELF